MPRYPSSPYHFKCRYSNTCPHLDGLSTTWVMEEYRRAEDDYQEHLRIIDAFRNNLETANNRICVLERENAELKAKFRALHQKQFKSNNKKNDEQNLDDATISAKTKKRGAPMGHQGWTRPKPNHIDYTVNVPAPTICPYCKSDKLESMKTNAEHFQEDIIIQPRAAVTRYLHEQAFCKHCNRPVVQAGKGEILNAAIGPIAKSAALYLRYRMGLSYRKTTDLFKELFGLSFVPASTVGFDKKAAQRGAVLYEDLLQKIRASAVLHADETSWRSDGVGHYVWFAGNENLAFFHIDRHRSAKVAKSIFGDNFGGVLVRDRYAAYNGIGKDWQSCISHILTKAKEINREHELLPETEKDAAIGHFCNRVMDFCSQLCDIGQKLKSGSISWSEAAKIEKRFSKKFNKICKYPFRFKPAETLRTYLSGQERKHLFTFLRNRSVPPTNNHAEQSVRFLVLFRKTSFGTRSKSGLKTHSIIPSLVQTARRQKVHPMKFLQTLFTENTAKAQAALYENSS